ncbi:MAG: YbaK/EbsC family protein [Chloroflexota bacterium]
MAKKKKLNSMRLLEANDIPYEAISYDASIKDAELVAEAVGLPEFTVFKTLMTYSVATEEAFVAMIPANTQLDLKKLASAADEKKVKMMKHADAEKATGLQVGGISPLMIMDKNWIIFINSSATEHQQIVISAGQRGTQLRIPVTPLMALIRARVADIATDG